jgi:hypothetical protein
MGILGRENELLKHQLKKYVGAVQKLRDGQQVRVQANFWDVFHSDIFRMFSARWFKTLTWCRSLRPT